jgi:16S rRNA (cytosine1402-N4)-methyltransferase
MSVGGGDESSPAGGPAPHIPVLLREMMAALAPRADGLYIDGTFGAGGYSRAILDIAGTKVVALDRDPSAVRAAAPLVAAMHGRLEIIEARFGDLADEARRFGPVDGIALDIGVSSMQFDTAARGFSFRFDGPLDMRMEQKGRSAADILAQADEEEIADILYYFGEERASRRIAREIVLRRKSAPVATTAALADLVKRVLPGKFGEIHPATRTFQALRIAVNDELGELARALAGAEEILAPGGRLVVVTFHSLEDRIVKQFFAGRSGRGVARSRRLPGEPDLPEPTFDLLGHQPVVPGAAETAANPRARSAKLRAAVRTSAPPRGGEPRFFSRTTGAANAHGGSR